MKKQKLTIDDFTKITLSNIIPQSAIGNLLRDLAFSESNNIDWKEVQQLINKHFPEKI
jgi:hypothetical protein